MSQSFAYRPGSSPTGPPSSAMVPSSPSGGPPGDPRKWSARFPVYQIDFTAIASGKRIAGTKRRVRWRFGFSNKDALEAGETGTACRGEEHDVTIVWSITSGKRLILADGQEVHYSTNRGTLLEYSWTMRGNHVLKVVAHAAPQMSATPGFRQYDLFIDGQSFFNMPKVYELGIKGPIPAHARTPGVVDRAERSARYYDLQQGRYVEGAPTTREEEEEDLAKAISASIEESRRHLKLTVEAHRSQDEKPPAIEAGPAPAPIPAGGNLLDFGSEPPAPAPAPPPAAVSPTVPPTDTFAAPAPPAYPAADAFAAQAPAPAASPVAAPGAMVPVEPQPGAYAYGGAPAVAPAPYAASPTPAPFTAASPAPAPYAATPTGGFVSQQPSQAPSIDQFASPPAAGQFAPQPASDPFAAQPAADDPFAPKVPPPPTFNDISSTILGAYSSTDQASVATPNTAYTPTAQPQLQPGYSEQQPPAEAPAYGVAPAPAPVEQSNEGAETQFAKLTITGSNFENEHVPAEKEEESKDDVSKAMKNLVNFDDLTSPVEPEMPLSMNPFESDKEKEAKKAKAKTSRGIPPVALKYAGPAPSLSEMQSIKPSSSGEKKPVMANPHAFDPNAANAGALVVHGSQNGYSGGPPPIQRATGFGLGATMNGGGYGGATQQPGYGAPPQQQQYAAPPQQQQYAAPPQQQPMYGAPQQQPMYGAPPPPQQQGYSNYSY